MFVPVKMIQSIVRSSLVVLLAVAYLLMSTAGATHELSHTVTHSGDHSLYGDGTSSRTVASHSLKGAISHITEGESFCFFCTHSPNVLVALAITFAPQSFVSPETSLPPPHHAPSITLSVVSLRGPPEAA